MQHYLFNLHNTRVMHRDTMGTKQQPTVTRKAQPGMQESYISGKIAKSCWQVLNVGGTGRPILNAGKRYLQHEQLNPVGRFWVSVAMEGQSGTQESYTFAANTTRPSTSSKKHYPLLHKKPHGLSPCGLYYHDILFIYLYKVLCLTVTAIRKRHWNNRLHLLDLNLTEMLLVFFNIILKCH